LKATYCTSKQDSFNSLIRQIDLNHFYLITVSISFARHASYSKRHNASVVHILTSLTRFTIECRKTKIKVVRLSQPITSNTNYPKNQTKLELEHVKGAKRGIMRATKPQLVFAFISDWTRKRWEILNPITDRSKVNVNADYFPHLILTTALKAF